VNTHKVNAGTLADMPDAPALTVDELAREAGLPSSTIRLYQNRGLLPPPERRGRVGYYGQQHRDRLRLIAHLQDRGFSLAAIKEALDAWESGRSIGQLLDVGDIAPGLARQPLRLSPDDFADRFAGVEITQSDLVRAAEMGLVEIDGPDVVVANPAFADLGPAIARLGIPVTEILDEHEALRRALSTVAERFQAVFERHVWSRFQADGMPADEVPRLAADVTQLTELATAVVVNELRDQFAALAAVYLDAATDRSERLVTDP
jgi:DNA-binding transcriptional MerR regulator